MSANTEIKTSGNRLSIVMTLFVCGGIGAAVVWVILDKTQRLENKISTLQNEKTELRKQYQNILDRIDERFEAANKKSKESKELELDPVQEEANRLKQLENLTSKMVKEKATPYLKELEHLYETGGMKLWTKEMILSSGKLSEQGTATPTYPGPKKIQVEEFKNKLVAALWWQPIDNISDISKFNRIHLTGEGTDKVEAELVGTKASGLLRIKVCALLKEMPPPDEPERF